MSLSLNDLTDFVDNIFLIFRNRKHVHLHTHNLHLAGSSVASRLHASAFMLPHPHITPFKSLYLLSRVNPTTAPVDALYFMFEELQYGGIQ